MSTEAADRAALGHALELYRAGSATQRKTIDTLFARGDSWEEIAQFAAFHMQISVLGLPPWQPPPCNIGPSNMATALAEPDPQRGYRAAALLRQRMLRCVASRNGRPIQWPRVRPQRPSLESEINSALERRTASAAAGPVVVNIESVHITFKSAATQSPGH